MGSLTSISEPSFPHEAGSLRLSQSSGPVLGASKKIDYTLKHHRVGLEQSNGRRRSRDMRRPLRDMEAAHVSSPLIALPFAPNFFPAVRAICISDDLAVLTRVFLVAQDHAYTLNIGLRIPYL
eukprot:6200433-Pleurochrysis_carterae.AAC.4